MDTTICIVCTTERDHFVVTRRNSVVVTRRRDAQVYVEKGFISPEFLFVHVP